MILTIGGGQVTKDEQDLDVPKIIETPTWTNGQLVTEETFLENLQNSIGKRICICGGPSKCNDVSSICIFGRHFIAVPSVRDWSGAPSWRSSLAVTGVLERTESGYFIRDASYEWIDS